MSVQANLKDVSVRLGSVQALDHLNLEIEPGTFVALLGPSGSGKTTTLNVLAGFTRPDAGLVTFDSADVTGVAPYVRDIGIVFQSYALFPHLTVGKNIEFPLRRRGVPRDRRRERVEEVLRLVGLEGYGDRGVTALSGGQRQRVALARAVVFEPRLLLLDEPLAALDKRLRDSMQLEIRALQRRLGITTVAVTHDQVEALTMADKVAVMSDGRIEQCGSPEDVYRRPASEFVARFLGEANLLEVREGSMQCFGRCGSLPDGTAVLRPEQLRIRPIDQRDPSGLSAEGTIDSVSFQGAHHRLRVRLEADPAVALTLTSTALGFSLGAGDRVRVEVDPDDLHVIPRTNRTGVPTRTVQEA
ncbi:ABC transporter ATP-binding protein [Jiangella alba]|uniref:Putative spermidine/putrescine transport system ATP-binding protein n=1 Tax=Jiangella alba TaxID=561176 RepID=A0A1H5PY03_9ACTN|nr:ABC transporter ATP-binding protein [Jiangella alba]SEF18742.1 putative spermidine/putrescine transport system ATP-binding protein [Jiangella alba]